MADIQRNIDELSISAPDGLDEARRGSIKAALESYKRTVLEHNLSNLRTLVEGIESRPSNPEAMSTLEEQVMREGLDEIADSPRGLLDPAVRPVLIEEYDLDGVYRIPYPQDRAAWFAFIRSAMQERNVTAGAFPPPDLEYLCTLVSGICGSGLYQHQSIQQYNLLDPAETKSSDDTIFVGPAGLPVTWHEELDIALCIKIGRNEEHGWGGSYLLWCRWSSDEQWKWRYAAHADQNASEVYDTLEEYLAFYAHFNEEGEDDMRIYLQYFDVETETLESGDEGLAG